MTELRRTPPRLLIVLAFLSVYFCWSATYTAMRVGVALLPATVLAGVRMLIGAVIMLTFCALRGRRIFCDRNTMWRLMLLGVMLLFGGNIGLVWSEEYLSSGLAALIVAVVPLYVVLIEMLLPRGDRLRSRAIWDWRWALERWSPSCGPACGADVAGILCKFSPSLRFWPGHFPGRQVQYFRGV